MHLNADLNPILTRRSKKDMPMKNLPKRLAAILIAGAVVAVPLAAQAQRKSPLADAPAIRKRFELRSTRFELGAGIGSTINQDYYHTIFFNVRAGFHITDWLALSGYAGFAAANVSTTFQSDLLNGLNMPPTNPPASEPTSDEAQASFQKIKGIYAVQLELVPFTGKYSLFGKLFAHYDFYGFVGPALIAVEPNSSTLSPCSDTNNGTGHAAFSCGVSGSKLGANFGLGLHSYFTNWLALNVELRDVLAKLNPSGRDTDSSLHATTADLTWTHTISVAANLVFYLPATPSVSP
jgi:outer membrane beta-barrel protein